MEPVVNASFPVLLPMLQQLLAAPVNSGSQVCTASSSSSCISLCCLVQQCSLQAVKGGCAPWASNSLQQSVALLCCRSCIACGVRPGIKAWLV